MEEICCQVEDLWIEESRLCRSEENERETDRIFSETQQLEESKPSSAI